VLRSIFGPKRYEVTGEWRKLVPEDRNSMFVRYIVVYLQTYIALLPTRLTPVDRFQRGVHNLHFLPGFIREIKSRMGGGHLEELHVYEMIILKMIYYRSELFGTS
jgi:hypothetical protein